MRDDNEAGRGHVSRSEFRCLRCVLKPRSPLTACPFAMLRRQVISARRAVPSLRRRRYLSTTAFTNALRDTVVDIHPEVRDALAAHRPVVALETTLITHGLPYPTNLETGQKLESIVRAHGSVPATIGIIDGRVKVGLNDNELQRLADTTRNKSVKVIESRV